jgi:hypothetical protein
MRYRRGHIMGCLPNQVYKIIQNMDELGSSWMKINPKREKGKNE